MKESFFINAKVRRVNLEAVFSLKRKELVFLNDTFSDDAKVFLRQIRGVPRIAYLFIHLRKHGTDGPGVLFV